MDKRYEITKPEMANRLLRILLDTVHQAAITNSLELAQDRNSFCHTCISPHSLLQLKHLPYPLLPKPNAKGIGYEICLASPLNI